jgi:nucleotide-binding universal stress UspA family protein
VTTVIGEYFDNNDADHVIMGSHEQSKIFVFLVGHIAEYVIHHTSVSETIVR